MSGNDAPQAPYLKLIKMTSFGAFTNEVVGPFSPHLNVVFGSNEAGKTTLASFVGGVLFGWEEARGNRNTYKPLNAERSGSLFFARDHIGDADEPNGSNEFGEAEEIELARTKNADGLVGDASLVADIDKETFQTMFSLTSDELRSLRNTTDVTAKLLTAGSGTGASPAHALADVQAQLAEYTSRAAGIEHSIVNLTARQNELRARMALAADGGRALQAARQGVPRTGTAPRRAERAPGRAQQPHRGAERIPCQAAEAGRGTCPVHCRARPSARGRGVARIDAAGAGAPRGCGLDGPERRGRPRSARSH